ncbi:hypothetical protein D9757_009651 [Collybiopsis confluens]|uniref:Uncharacterized protein n=1 Tax=Collybiopsis confluens TaxID=2823264 RepID=A0A8H5LW78_9AGAR|nr:hypothetical protein D9757_009651 [Collybiopsis confluens]
MSAAGDVPSLLSFIQHNQPRAYWAHSSEWDQFAQYWYNSPKQDNVEWRSFPHPLDIHMPASCWQEALLSDTEGKLLVTQGYSDLYRRLEIGFDLKNTPRQRLGPQAALITGQPGTGKSISLWYLAIKLLRDYRDEPLVVTHPGSTLMFYKGHAFEALDPNMTSFNPEILQKFGPEPYCFALHDSRENFNPSYWKHCIPIYASSPGDNKLATFVSHKSPFIWSIPTWTRKELLEGVRQKLEKDIELGQHVEKSSKPRPFHPIPEEHATGLDGMRYVYDFAGGSEFISRNYTELLDLNAMDVDSDQSGIVYPEIEDGPCTSVESALVQLVDNAVREVGFIPRDTYLYMDNKKHADSQNGWINDYMSQLQSSPQQIISLLSEEPRYTTRAHVVHRVFHQHMVAVGNNDTSQALFVVHFRTAAAQKGFETHMRQWTWTNLRELLSATVRSGHVTETVSEFDYGHHPCSHGDKEGGVETTSQLEKDSASAVPPSNLTARKHIVLSTELQYMANFTTSCPIAPKLDTYYEGHRITPLIDSFFFREERIDPSRHYDTLPVVLYFVQFSQAEKKRNDSEIGQKLVEAIYVASIKHCQALRPERRLELVRFLLLQPTSDNLQLWEDPEWILPKFSFEPEVYYSSFPIAKTDPRDPGLARPAPDNT